ncbi:hypothetical protein TW85_14195 [Marinomonas sp. S3726]|nr:hypothetical protein TW85_14195 [Marinomonas sp. S3726]
MKSRWRPPATFFMLIFYFKVSDNEVSYCVFDDRQSPVSNRLRSSCEKKPRGSSQASCKGCGCTC